MEKAILILDEMPENCNCCKFLDFGRWDNEIVATCFAMAGLFTELNENKPDWCPLKELPTPYDITKRPWEKDGYMGGWNDYRHEIVGDDDEFGRFGGKSDE